MELQALLEKAEPILRQAGELVRSIPHPAVYSKEGHANFVTEADMASQQFLMEHLSPLLPEARFFAEEQEENKMAPGFNWVIDPIDGTTNFIRGYQPSAISVGLVKDGQGVMGLVLDLGTGELFTAVRGGGAFCNGNPLQGAQAPLEKRCHCVWHRPLLPGAGGRHLCRRQGAVPLLRGPAPERLCGPGPVPCGGGPVRRLLRGPALPLGLRRRFRHPAGGGLPHGHPPGSSLLL